MKIRLFVPVHQSTLVVIECRVSTFADRRRPVVTGCISASLTAAACARQSQPTRHINICSPDIVVVLQYSVQIAPQFSYHRADL